MLWMNEHDVADVAHRVAGLPNLERAADTLRALVYWTNGNSDGWPYWAKPARAAQRLIAMLHAADRFDPADVSAADLVAALRPVRAFLTRQGVDHSAVIR